MSNPNADLPVGRSVGPKCFFSRKSMMRDEGRGQGKRASKGASIHDICKGDGGQLVKKYNLRTMQILRTEVGGVKNPKSCGRPICKGPPSMHAARNYGRRKRRRWTFSSRPRPIDDRVKQCNAIEPQSVSQIHSLFTHSLHAGIDG